jgi:hypothetical protein
VGDLGTLELRSFVIGVCQAGRAGLGRAPGAAAGVGAGVSPRPAVASVRQVVLLVACFGRVRQGWLLPLSTLASAHFICRLVFLQMSLSVSLAVAYVAVFQWTWSPLPFPPCFSASHLRSLVVLL